MPEQANVPDHAEVTQTRPSPRCPWVGSTEEGPSIRTEGSGLRALHAREQARAAPASDHEAVLLPVVGHQDDVAVGRPDEPG